MMATYVLSDGEMPVKLFYDEHTAFELGKFQSNAYLDVFNSVGDKVASWHYVNGAWTQDF